MTLNSKNLEVKVIRFRAFSISSVHGHIIEIRVLRMHFNEGRIGTKVNPGTAFADMFLT
jgi:hypothetical protein